MQKNKLLLTSALVGAAMLSTAAVNAEMKVSGYVEYTHISDGSDESANKKAGAQALKSGTETDIIFSNGLDLGNGMKATVTANITNESNGTSNSGATGTAMGLDAMVLDIDTGKGFNIVLGSGGFGPGDIGEGPVPTIMDVSVDTGVTGVSDVNQYDLSNVYSVGAKMGGFAFAYTPNISTLANSGSFGAGTTGTMQSAYEIAYKGKPIEGSPLSVSAAIHKAEARLAAASGQESTTYGIGYSIEGINVGINYVEAKPYVASGAQSKTEETNIGATYSVNGVGLGLTQSKTKSNASSSNKTQTATSAQVGYALGPVGIALAYTKVDNLGYVTNVDGKATTLRIATKF